MGGGQVITLRSTIEGSDGTKVGLYQVDESNTYVLKWQKDDSFKVVCAGCTGPSTFDLTDGPGNPDAGIFSGTLPEGTSTDYYAVVNYTKNEVSVTDNNLQLFISKDKYAWANQIYKEGIPLVAKVKSGVTTFNHIFGLLELKLSATEPFLLKKITVHDLAGNMLWGTCSVPINDDGSLDYDNVTMSGGDNTVTMTLNSGRNITSEETTSYYIPVPKGALEGGFSVVLYEATSTESDSKVARTYSFMQKITGTKAMPRAGILSVNAAVTAKPESLDEKGRGYYKSLFVNSGKGLDRFKGNSAAAGEENNKIPAIDYMGLTNDYEYFYGAGNVETQQTSVVIGNDSDANGVLLYPDGSPRFRMVFNSGGNSVTHGHSLGETGRSRYCDFFNNGGSYTSVCAGSFLAARDVSSASKDDKPFTYGFIPVTLTHTGLPHPMGGNPSIFTNMEILPAAKTAIEGVNDGKLDLLLDGAGENMTTYDSNVGIKDVAHHGGGYLPFDQASVAGIQPLMKYWYTETTSTDKSEDIRYYRENNFYTDSPTDNNKNVLFWSNSETGTDDVILTGPGTDHYYSTWAYKNGNTGRAVCTGSHPEGTDRACDKQFTGFMFRYAMEGNGDAVVKSGDLTLGQTRYMNVTPSSYTNPANNNAGIGDRQYHHFKFTVPAGGYDNIVLRLDSDCDSNSGIDLYLGLRKGGLAWLSDADYTLCNKGGKKEIRIKHLSEGNWYVSVFCATTVVASLYQAESGFLDYYKYSDKTQVLNGVPYSICIAQDGTIKELFPSAFGENSDDFTNSMDD